MAGRLRWSGGAGHFGQTSRAFLANGAQVVTEGNQNSEEFVIVGVPKESFPG